MGKMESAQGHSRFVCVCVYSKFARLALCLALLRGVSVSTEAEMEVREGVKSPRVSARGK